MKDKVSRFHDYYRQRQKKKLQPDTVKDTIGLKPTPLLQRVIKKSWPHREIENLLIFVL